MASLPAAVAVSRRGRAAYNGNLLLFGGTLLVQKSWRMLCGLLCLTAELVFPQTITTIAGTDFVFPRDAVAGLNAPFGLIEDVALDQQGNLYVSDPDNAIIARLTPDGMVTVFAGNGIRGFSGDGGPAIRASLERPAGMALDTQGNLFFVDATRIRKIDAQGSITTIAGNGSAACPAAGPGPGSSVSKPGGLAVDPSGAVYFIDIACHVLVRVSPGGTLEILAEQLTTLGDPPPLAVDGLGNVYFPVGLGAIAKRSPSGPLTILAGQSDQRGFAGDGGPAADALLGQVRGLRLDAARNLFIADTTNNRIRRIGTDGTIRTVAGRGPAYGGVNTFFPTNIPAIPGEYSGDGGPATEAGVRGPRGLAVNGSGELFFADTFNNVVRKVTTDGKISTVAGSRRFRYSGDGGPATLATFNNITGVAADAQGNVFLADAGANVVRRISASGIVTTYAGTGRSGYSGDGGPAAAAQLSIPVGVALDSLGNLYIADLENNRVRRVSPDGIISTFAGGADADGPTPATQRTVRPYSIAVDASDRVLVGSDFTVLRISPAGTVESIVAPNQVNAVAARSDGAVYYASFFTPYSASGVLTPVLGLPPTISGIAGDSHGNVYFSDATFQRVLRRASDGSTSTFAGASITGFGGDGDLATLAAFNYPWGLAADPAGNVYIADNLNHRIRKVLAAPPSLDISATQLSFDARAGGPPAAGQKILLTGSIPGIPFTTDTGGAAWLTVDPGSGQAPRVVEVTADPGSLEPGSYQATLRFRAPVASPGERTVDVRFTVGESLPAMLDVDTNSLSFTFPRSAATRSQALTVLNTGGGRLPFTVAAQTSSGGGWLTVSASAGEATPREPVILSVTANSAGLAPGTYTGSVTVRAGSSSRDVRVTLTVSSRDQAILLSQNGLSFTAVSGGGLVPPQKFHVLNLGTGVMNWSVSTVRGSTWLSTSVTQGSTDAAAASVPAVEVSVSPSGLVPGRYYDLVQVVSDTAANTPQVISVFLEVLPPDATPGAVVQPSELVFAVASGRSAPSAQEVLVYNLAGSPVALRSRIEVPGALVLQAPGDATVSPSRPTRIAVQPFTQGLGPGRYSGQLTLQFSDGTVRAVRISVVVTDSASSAIPKQGSQAAGEACVPSELLASFVTVGQGPMITAGYPASIVVAIQDDCGQPLAKGSAHVSFSNGDAPLSLMAAKDGYWEATWATRRRTGAVKVKIQAADDSRRLRGEREISTDLSARQSPPSIAPGGVVSVAGPVSNVALAPGGAITIYGTALTDGRTETAGSAPLPVTLAGTQVFMAGRRLPIFYASPTQINAIVPYELEANTSHQIWVSPGAALSTQVAVDVAPAQPAVFTTNGLATGPAVVFALRGSEQFQVSPSRPARAGDVVTIFCTGLGAVTPAVATGQAAPLDPLARVREPVILRVGGREVPAGFAGLSPGFAGLYQINAVLPDGIGAGADVPLTIEVSGQTSPVATIAIQ